MASQGQIDGKQLVRKLQKQGGWIIDATDSREFRISREGVALSPYRLTIRKDGKTQLYKVSHMIGRYFERADLLAAIPQFRGRKK